MTGIQCGINRVIRVGAFHLRFRALKNEKWLKNITVARSEILMISDRAAQAR